jgi:2-hydroxy-3-keto-5-methylthiopentenyl-1-phosphate phosphatase
VFVVSQVDFDGYVLTDPFVDVVIDLYTEDPSKTLAKELAPDCATEANALAKSKCKTQDI